MPATSPAPSRARTRRAAADRCPGVLRLTEAADGLLARVRLPGGLISGEQLRVLARLADDLGDGRAELTARGNVQLRGLNPEAAGPLSDALFAAGLLPSLSHDQVRNVLASPLAGLDGGADLTALVRALDAALCARPRLAGLSGRFLFALDDGRGDVAGLGADVVAIVRPGGTAVDGAIVNGLAIPANGPDDSRAGVIAAMLAVAGAFLDVQADPASPTGPGGTVWRIADLPGGAERVRSLAAARLGLMQPEPPVGETAVEVPARAPDRPVGLLGRSAVLLAPLGRLTSAQLTWIADRLADEAARVTPWRSVVLPHLADAAGVLRDAAGLGFGTDGSSPWLRVTACAGRPGCASALADVQADAVAFGAGWPGRIVHVSGCARHCGRPAGTEIDVTAGREGYEVAGV